MLSATHPFMKIPNALIDSPYAKEIGWKSIIIYYYLRRWAWTKNYGWAGVYFNRGYIVCSASIKKILLSTGISNTELRRHLKRLCYSKWIAIEAYKYNDNDYYTPGAKNVIILGRNTNKGFEFYADTLINKNKPKYSCDGYVPLCHAMIDTNYLREIGWKNIVAYIYLRRGTLNKPEGKYGSYVKGNKLVNCLGLRRIISLMGISSTEYYRRIRALEKAEIIVVDKYYFDNYEKPNNDNVYILGQRYKGTEQPGSNKKEYIYGYYFDLLLQKRIDSKTL